MGAFSKYAGMVYLMAACMLALACAVLCSCSCSSPTEDVPAADPEGKLDTSRFVVAVDDEPDTVDFQCTSLYYTVANNVFSRLVETELGEDGEARIAPSLAESWEVSDDGCVYTFHLKEGVTFSNGNELTSSDVLYSFTRLLTHPDSCNQDILECVAGAQELERGDADQLEGFEILGDLDFKVTLNHPFAAFLPCLSMAGASIMDEQTTRAAGERFGKEVDAMIGTGPFILRDWRPGEGMLLVANPDCFEGPPLCEGLDLRFVIEPEEARTLFEEGELDILDLDDVPDYAEYYMHGDIYQDKLYEVNRIALNYVALNETVAPLDDVRVRKALQLALDRRTLLDAVYGGRGAIENGIFPRGLYGYNPNLAAIPFDLEKAKELLGEADLSDGFDLVISMRASATQAEVTLARLVASMWEDAGVRASVEVMSEDDFMRLRKEGKIGCYCATWTADYNDPDNFIYTFFGNRQNTTFRSICYQNGDAMDRVHEARSITDPDERLREYRDLERIIAQDDAAWVPLFSRQRIYVLSDRIEGTPALWNGSMKSRYRDVSVRESD